MVTDILIRCGQGHCHPVYSPGDLLSGNYANKIGTKGKLTKVVSRFTGKGSGGKS